MPPSRPTHPKARQSPTPGRARKVSAGAGPTPHRPVAFTGPRPRLAGEGELQAPKLTAPAAHQGKGQPRLRLVGEKSVVKPDWAPAQGTAIAGTTDPRWVLAVRAAEQLQGSILPPDKRDRLVQMGKMFGLTAFDANLIIAIVQDQARRGYEPSYCPTAGEAQLRMVPQPQAQKWMTGQRTLLISGIIAGFIALELIVLSWVF